MSNIIPGIFEWTGELGSGKTTAALESGATPDRIWFCDADVKGKATAKILENANTPFGKFVDVTELIAKTNRLYEVWPILKAQIDSIKKGQFDVIICDSWPEIYQIIRAYVRQNTHEFDDPKEWKKAAGSGYQFLEGKISRTAREIEKQIINSMMDKAIAVHITSHIKDDYDANVVVGQIAESSKAIHQIAATRIWLRHNSEYTTPIMLFIKPYGEVRLNESTKRMKMFNITPRKAVPDPNKKEESVWDVIERYRANPAHGREPLEDEIPNEHERYILDRVLSEDQKKAWFARIDAKKDEEKKNQLAQFGEVAKIKTLAKSLFGDGKTPPQIVVEINKQIDDGKFPLQSNPVTIPMIANWISE